MNEKDEDSHIRSDGPKTAFTASQKWIWNTRAKPGAEVLFLAYKTAKVCQKQCRIQAPQLLLGLWMALGLLACDPKPGAVTTAQTGTPLTYFTSGDPLQIIDGAKLNKTSPFTLGTIELYNNFGSLDYYRFVQNRALGPVRPAQDGQKPPEKAVAVRKVRTHRFEKRTEERYLYTNGEPDFELEFKLEDGRLHWTGLHGQTIQPLHYSVSEDVDAFSLLGIYEDKDEGSVLVRIIFMRPNGSSTVSRVFIEKVDEIFNYLFGPNVMAKWKQPLKTISLCGSRARAYKDQVETSVEQWQRALEGGLQLRVAAPGTYPPFSDLNTSCIYSVDQYIMDPREDHIYFGLSVFSAYLPEARLLDSDVFIFEQEFAKIAPSPSPSFLPAQRQRTLTHEIGHLLGLHHIFDGTESIMSYDRNHTQVEEYDKKAIQALYPQK